MKKIIDIATGNMFVQWQELAGPIDENFAELENGKLDKDELAQTTGNSTTTPMSQKAVTTALGTVDKVYITQLDITTKTDKATISEGDKTEINKIFEAANNGKIIYCPNVGLYATYRDDIWPNDISVIVGSILYSANISGSSWGITKRELYNEGGSGSDGNEILYYTANRDSEITDDISPEIFDISTYSNDSDAKIIRVDVAPSSAYTGPSFVAFEAESGKYFASWKAFGPYKGSEEYLTGGSGNIPKQGVIFGKYGDIELVKFDGTDFKYITFNPPSSGTIPDAPSDGKVYARKNNNWKEINEVIIVEGLLDLAEAGTVTSENLNAIFGVSTFSGISAKIKDKILLAKSDYVPGAVVTSFCSGSEDSSIIILTASLVNNVVSFTLNFNNDILSSSSIKLAQLVEDAPSDGKKYVRQNGNWVAIE